jgi:hypothetical protein
MTIFYRGHGVRITHEVFEVLCPTHQSFALRDLSYLRVGEQAAEAPPAVSVARTGSTGVAGATALAAAVGWAEGWQAFDSPAVVAATLTVLVASAVVSGACWRLRKAEQELLAVHHGTQVSLYRSADATTFAQVKRGLVRAIEQLGDTR